jgi:HSP20 family protein
MNLVKREKRNDLFPWAPFRDWDFPMGRLLEEMWGDTEATRGMWAPAVDLKETDQAYILKADLPGMKKEDITVSVEEDVVTLKGERKHEEKKEEEGYHRVERRYGSFQRSFRIPGGVDTVKVAATYNDGVLELTLPKREEVKPKRIEVKVG